MEKYKELAEASKRMRKNIIQLTYSTGKKGAHVAPSLSLVEILAVLFLKVMNLEEDEFILSKGHGGLAYYTALREAGVISGEQLQLFETDGGEFPGQPSRNDKYGIIFSSGSLGMGLSYAAGTALAAKMKKKMKRVYVVVGDGELNEGSNWEAAMFMKQKNLDNVVVIVDKNGLQSDGETSQIMSVHLEEVWKSFGWNVIRTNGHDIGQLLTAFEGISEGVPNVIIADTIKGKGVSFMENQKGWHHNHLREKEYHMAMSEVDDYGDK